MATCLHALEQSCCSGDISGDISGDGGTDYRSVTSNDECEFRYFASFEGDNPRSGTNFKPRQGYRWMDWTSVQLSMGNEVGRQESAGHCTAYVGGLEAFWQERIYSLKWVICGLFSILRAQESCL